MQSLLGRIVAIESNDTRHKITFEPLCTLPDRKAPPEHLKNQKLTISEDTTDVREIGEVGDSIVICATNSYYYLHPLRCHSRTLRSLLEFGFYLELYWWKDDTPPNWTARLGHKTISGTWEQGSYQWSSRIELSQLATEWPTTPFDIEFTCGDLKTTCTILPDEVPNVTLRHETMGEIYGMRSRFLSVDITSHGGGAIFELRSKTVLHKTQKSLKTSGMHFSRRQGRHNLTHHPLDWRGHTDRFRTGWGEWKEMREVKMEVVGAAREANTSRVTMQGEIEDGLRTQFSVTLLDDWPLLLMRREFSLHPKKEEKKDEAEPKQPIDEMRLFQTGFRCAVQPDKKASRVWCRADGETVPFSLARENEHQDFWHWKMEEGFALFEQVGRKEFLLYFYDTQNAPHLGLWRGPHVATLEPFWAGVPLKPGESTGSSLGLTAGESGGANELGAWVACRARQDNQWQCALLARCFSSNVEAVFQIGEETQRVPLMPMFLPGIGTVYGAMARFELNDKSEAFETHLKGGA